ncbi:MAG: iron-containing redox enzyme family protein [Gammaproteobacteria bacterium]|nr:iron-containing redox enzyme family protein [Gammaproteobacteria bacterium]MCP5136182.1 iron-containing redox enzyme family protein [Gammaproteobacteria bacterium]
MNFYAQLLAATAAEREELLAIPFIRHGWAGELSLESYVAFLTQAYHHVRHTTPLLMACGSRLPGDKEWLRDAMAEYVEEEVGHQEWILNDIATCGGDAERVRNETPGLAAELMVAYAYHVIDRRNPVGFLGMVLVLEGTSIKVATEAADKLRARLELPKTAFTYLSSHGSLDVSHMNFYETLVNRIENPSDRDFVIHCAKRFYKLYGDVFRNLPLSLNASEVMA